MKPLILLVHDEQESPLPRKHFLEQAGCELVLTKSGSECLRRIVELRPALVILDVLIEGKNGFEILRELRTRRTAAELPVVVCGGIYRSRVYRDEALALGAQDYVVPPLQLDEFARQMFALAQKSAPPKSAAA